MVAVAVLVGVILYLASRSSRSSAGADPSAAAVTSAAPTLTGVLANSTGPSRSTVPSPTPTPTAPTDATASAPPADPTPRPPRAPPTPHLPTPPYRRLAHRDPAHRSGRRAAAGDGAGRTAAPPPPSYDADGKLLCADASVAVARAGSGAGGRGGECDRRDDGHQQRQRSLPSGRLGHPAGIHRVRGGRHPDVVDGRLLPGQGTDVRELAPGESLKYTVKWSGTTSAPGCTGERAPLAPGSYSLIAQLGALSSPPAAFTVG
ncbi:MAG: hypothetical protein U0R72_15495 [Nakamurella multipartita]